MRRCSICGIRLSVYNSNPHCWSHMISERFYTDRLMESLNNGRRVGPRASLEVLDSKPMVYLFSRAKKKDLPALF